MLCAPLEPFSFTSWSLEQEEQNAERMEMPPPPVPPPADSRYRYSAAGRMERRGGGLCFRRGWGCWGEGELKYMVDNLVDNMDDDMVNMVDFDILFWFRG